MRNGIWAGLVTLLPAVTLAANVCVWTYDTQDVWYDNEVGSNIHSGYWVERTLEDLGHDVTACSRNLPTSIDDFDAVFCLMGWYRC